MKLEEFRDAVTGIDEEYIIETVEKELCAEKKRKGVLAPAARRTRRYALFAAAAAVALLALALTLFFALRTEEPPEVLPTTETRTSTESTPAPEPSTTPAPTSEPKPTPDRTPAATVCLDAEIGVRMLVSADGTVLEFDTESDEARSVIKALPCIGMQVDDASALIVEALIENGFLTNENNALLLSVNSATPLAYTLTENIERALDVIFISVLPGGRLMMQTNVAGDGANAKEISATASFYGISFGKAELVMRLCDVVPDMNERSLTALSITELKALCEKYGVPTESVVKVLESQAIAIAKKAFGGEHVTIYNCEFCCYEDLDSPAWFICAMRGSERRLFFVDATDGAIVWEKKIEGELTPDEAKELAVLRYAIDNISIQKITASTKDGCTVTIEAMNLNTLEREKYFISVDLATGITLLMNKKTQK